MASTPTIIDVAKAARVSMKTVSRVINNEAGVRAETRQRVMAAVEQLGYQRNLFARGLRADRSLVLGLLYENPRGDYPADILYGALNCCRAHGYHLSVEVIGNRDGHARTQKFLAESKPDGVLVTPPVCDDASVMRALHSAHIPYVRISPREPMDGECYVGIDDLAAGKMIMRHLLDLGHRRIGLIRGVPGHGSSYHRENAYRQCLMDAEISVDPDLIVAQGFSLETGVRGAEALLDLPQPPSAIVASNDEVAAGILSVAYARGLSVPDDLSITGFDGGIISQVVWPKLTTIAQPIRELGRRAAELLINRTKPDGKFPGYPLILPHDLIVAGSSTTCPDFDIDKQISTA